MLPCGLNVVLVHGINKCPFMSRRRLSQKSNIGVGGTGVYELSPWLPEVGVFLSDTGSMQAALITACSRRAAAGCLYVGWLTKTASHWPKTIFMLGDVRGLLRSGRRMSPNWVAGGSHFAWMRNARCSASWMVAASCSALALGWRMPLLSAKSKVPSPLPAALAKSQCQTQLQKP